MKDQVTDIKPEILSVITPSGKMGVGMAVPLPMDNTQAAATKTTPIQIDGVKYIPIDQCMALSSEEMSKGEKAFNWWVYHGMNYWLNLGMSMVITDFFTHGRGKPLFTKGVGRASKTLSAAGVPEKFADWLSHIALGTFSLNSGGNILVVPLKYLEDNKRKVVHWINKKFYKDELIAPDGHEETPDEIHIVEEQPPQSWGHIIWRRTKGWAATTAVGLSLDATFKKKLDEPYINEKGHEITYSYGQDRMAQGIVDAMKNLPFGEKLLSYPWVKRYAFYASLDSVYTWITSTIMLKTKDTKKAKLPHEIDNSRDPAGEMKEDEIVVHPEAEKKPRAGSMVMPAQTSREELKSRKPVQLASHADRAQTSADPNYAMAP